MEVKKSKQKSLNKNRTLYFLLGLNLVLLGIYGLFGIQNAIEPVEQQEVILVQNTPPTNIILAERPIEEDILPAIDEPLPPPPLVPQDIEETIEPIESTPLEHQELIRPNLPDRAKIKSPDKISIDDLFDKVQETPKEERITDPLPVNRVTHMAVYPGCETYEGQKRELVRCFGDNLSKDLIKFLDTEYPETSKPRVQVQLEFHINTDGEIININAKRGDEEFMPQAKRALEHVSKYLIKSNKKIKPATLDGDKKVTLIFQNNVILQNPNR